MMTVHQVKMCLDNAVEEVMTDVLQPVECSERVTVKH
jgi:hypothetical protein